MTNTFQLMDFILHFIRRTLQDSDDNIFISWNFNSSLTLWATLYNQNNFSERPRLLSETLASDSERI